MRLGRIELVDNPEGSCVVENAATATAAAAVDAEAVTAERVLALFRRNFSETGASKAELRDTAIEEVGISRTWAYAAINRLLNDGRLINKGSESRPLLKLGVYAV